jgi:acetoin utilization deacetylase AcuC-like enzyme
MAAGARDADYESAYRGVVIPALDRFQPQIAAGVGGLRCARTGPARRDAPLNGRLRRGWWTCSTRTAARLCGHRIAYVLEGGYHLAALRACLETVIK